MKLSLSRALVVAGALALSIVPAFAQLSFNGYYRGGSMTSVDTGNNATTALQDRIRLNVSFAAPDDMFGFKARVQADSAGTSSAITNLFTDFAPTAASLPATAKTTLLTPVAGLKYGYGYGKLLDGMVKLSAGYLDLTDYAAVQGTGNYYFGNVYSDDVTGAGTPLLSGQKGSFLGTAVQVWPVEGLSVAATVRTDGSTLATHHLGFDAYYLMPGLGKVIAASQLGLYSATPASASDDLARSFVSAGFTYLGFKGLTATAALRSTWASGKAAYGTVAIVEYSSGPLFADLSTDIDFTNSHYYAEGEVSYLVIPQIKVRAYGAFADVATTNINLALTNVSKLANTYAVGADLVFPIGKGEIQAGVVYGDKANLQFPILVKANF